jgi:hypothetical protein
VTDDNPRLGPTYPYITHWRCSHCGTSTRMAEAKEREWCMHCRDAHPLTLLTRPQPRATVDRPAINSLPHS